MKADEEPFALDRRGSPLHRRRRNVHYLWPMAGGRRPGDRTASGSEKRNVAPAFRFVAHRRPPWFSTMVRLIASPRPRPRALVVAKGEKRRSVISAAMPRPLSLTATSIVLPLRVAATTTSRR